MQALGNYTDNITNDGKCNYMDMDKLNAEVMLRDCINAPTNNTKYIHPTIVNNSKYISLAGDNANYIKPIVKEIKISNDPTEESLRHEGENIDLVEGFVAGPSFSDGGPGEKYIKLNECPQGFEYCEKTKLCKQVCRNCVIDPNIEEKLTDFCQYGFNYNGIDVDGNSICSRNFDDLLLKGFNVDLSYKFSDLFKKDKDEN